MTASLGEEKELKEEMDDHNYVLLVMCWKWRM